MTTENEKRVVTALESIALTSRIIVDKIESAEAFVTPLMVALRGKIVEAIAGMGVPVTCPHTEPEPEDEEDDPIPVNGHD